MFNKEDKIKPSYSPHQGTQPNHTQPTPHNTMVRPITLTISISKPDLVSAVCSAAERDGEKGDYNFWVRQYLRKKLGVKQRASHKPGCRNQTKSKTGGKKQ